MSIFIIIIIIIIIICRLYYRLASDTMEKPPTCYRLATVKLR